MIIKNTKFVYICLFKNFEKKKDHIHNKNEIKKGIEWGNC